jgi:hypothetical protein
MAFSRECCGEEFEKFPYNIPAIQPDVLIGGHRWPTGLVRDICKDDSVM